MLGETVSIIMENEQLIMKSPEGPDLKLYWHEGEYYFIKESKVIIRLYKNKQGQTINDFSGFGGNDKFIKNKNP